MFIHPSTSDSHCVLPIYIGISLQPQLPFEIVLFSQSHLQELGLLMITMFKLLMLRPKTFLKCQLHVRIQVEGGEIDLSPILGCKQQCCGSQTHISPKKITQLLTSNPVYAGTGNLSERLERGQIPFYSFPQFPNFLCESCVYTGKETSSRFHWHLRLDNLLFGGAVQCIIRCSAASLASMHKCQEYPSSTLNN